MKLNLFSSVHPEHSKPRQSPIPDPLLPPQHHSIEAVCHASAILRRVKLLKACQYISRGDGISPNQVEAIARTKEVCDLKGLPVWWCPWLHDTALVVEAATKGLFSVFGVRDEHATFAPAPIEAFLRQSFATGRSALPSSNDTQANRMDMWIKKESEKFPELQEIERRLSLFCDAVTAKAANGPDRYINLPMFDHGSI
mmetsp:Transcript_26243/g.72434  ORF Transcript_26243/g.72434 Transcript_26243/m.72434 type:complete len:198 (+) Transcript_26243:6635-7228(+)